MMSLLKTILLVVFLAAAALSFAQTSAKATIEPCSCNFTTDPEVIKLAPPAYRSRFRPLDKIDSSFKTECGYLIVPENREKKHSRMIKLPYVIVRSKNPAKHKDPVLYTAGGPGGSSLGWVVNSTRSVLIEDRDCIALEQRGTRYALPYLRSFELDDAIKGAYRRNGNIDSAVLSGVKAVKGSLQQRGIDLAGYNTDATVSDIHDLLSLLHIDSVNLFGSSYSGGLMLAVLQKDPTRIRSLALDSPLPTFVPIDEDEPVNFREALGVLFRHVQQDSSAAQRYDHLEERFDRYFTSIKDSTFYLRYLEPGTKDSLSIAYTKNELLDIIINQLYDDRQRSHLPYLITQIIAGRHETYMTEKFNGLFRSYGAPDGMRISVYCADQTAYHSEKVIQEIGNLYPYLPGYRINDVYRAMCDCWKSPPIRQETRQGFYSLKPALLADGEMDPACRPLYIDRINHYMPNSQRFLLINKGHGVFNSKMMEIYRVFLNDPMKKIISTDPGIIGY
ncbi:alpha/beta fold hydrolase [Paraflavitalea sp. CAU 1676]|uniref:alpha/beta fold hydrolase n=1 Tax=Paraflavitalea sp. CAU 1676 TaxID=3032598 RepID=UPI0023DCD4F7|nr:alpha/beta fold hydrolase [Paraflavitalea sp. CAU 1676]MDF2190687.1 alpha/beta fold hydrolase [Paraflavitalea sp. CAU 1676]